MNNWKSLEDAMPGVAYCKECETHRDWVIDTTQRIVRCSQCGYGVGRFDDNAGEAAITINRLGALMKIRRTIIRE